MSKTPDQSDSLSAFDLLHQRIQRELYSMKWTHLRPIQVDSIKIVRSTDMHLLISANTAAGKTEAAFLPILSDYLEKERSTIHTIYVGPLKALINDQFRRLGQLCERSEIPVHPWHGDVSPSAKKKLMDHPSGVLLITPESIESLFVNRSDHLVRLFKDLRFVVIDELHSFIGNDRGMHLRSLLARISAICTAETRYVGLSATIGDLSIAKKWICPDVPESVACVTSSGESKEIRYQIKTFIKPASILASGSTENESDLAQDIVKNFSDKTALIFTNSRSLAEMLTDQAKRIAKRIGLKCQFEVHHGSLSKESREFTEDALRSDRSTVAFCTTTLEMGIDLGNIKEVGQIGAPSSVSSLAQRLGRSGRKDNEPSVMRLYIIEREDTKDNLVARLRPDLLQAIAMTELLLSKWCEPPLAHQLHLNALVQQTLSVIREHGGITANDLHMRLETIGPFRSATVGLYLKILKSMGAAELIEQTSDGLLILGEKGERIVDSYEFYAVFESSEEYKVLYGAATIGSVSVDVDSQAGKHIILGGRRWEITSIDTTSKYISVRPSPAGMPPTFEARERGDVHPKIHETMRKLLCEENLPTYLDQNSKQLLQEARCVAIAAGIREGNLVEAGKNLILFTWAGNRITRTLSQLLTVRFALTCIDDPFCIEIQNIGRSQFVAHLMKLRETYFTQDELCATVPPMDSGKYMPFLTDELKRLSAYYTHYDLQGTRQYLDNLFSSGDLN